MENALRLLDNANQLLEVAPANDQVRTLVSNRAMDLAKELRGTIRGRHVPSEMKGEMHEMQLKLEHKAIEWLSETGKSNYQTRKLLTPTFDGTDPSEWFDFSESFQSFASGLEDSTKTEQMRLALSGTAKKHIVGCETIDEMWSALRLVYENERAIETRIVREAWEMIRLNPSNAESALNWRAKIKSWQRDMKRAKLENCRSLLDSLSKAINKKLPHYVWYGAVEKNGFFNLDKLTDELERFDNAYATQRQLEPHFESGWKGKKSFDNKDQDEGWKQKGRTEQTNQRGKPKTCHNCGSREHFIAGCPDIKKQQKYSRPISPRRCWQCGELGHEKPVCPERVKQIEPIALVETESSGQLGLVEEDGDRLGDEVMRGEHTEEFVENDIDREEMPGVDIPIVFEAVLDGLELELVGDSACPVLIVPIDYYPKVDWHGPTRKFRSCYSEVEKAIGPYQRVVEVGGKHLKTNVYFGKVEKPLAGREFLRRYNFGWDWNSGDVHFTVGGETVVLPRSKCRMSLEGATFLVTAAELVEDEELEDSQPELICADFMRETVEKYQHLCDRLGKTNVMKHQIQLLDPDAQPVCEPERRFPVALLERARQDLKEMLESGLIRPSDSEWAFPIVPILKKDGSIRLAIDYRRLNDLCKKPKFPMPRIDATLEVLAGAAFFTKLDLIRGYYQVEIEEADKEKTAFRFDGNLFEFNRMPFGLASAPQTFQRLMSRVIANIPAARCYLDDVIVFSRTKEDHRRDVEQVLQALDQAGLGIKAKKCSFGLQEVEFLGFKVREGQISPTEEKLKAMRGYPRPTSVREVERFVGMIGFYRRMIPDFSILAAPLHKVQRSKKLEWTNECEEAFQTLKQRMLEYPVVHLPDFSRPFIVRSDASNDGMGAVLQQEQEGQRVVVEYASKAFSDTQKRYATIEKEATALMWALNKWEHFLLGGEFTLETDHRPLEWLRNKRNCRGKLGRMALRLAEFDQFNIKHIPGGNNKDADALSRIYLLTEFDEELEGEIQRRPEAFEQQPNGQVYFTQDGQRRLWVPRAQRNEVIQAIHDENMHLGVDRAMYMARDRFFWPHMKRDIKRHIKECHVCATKKISAYQHAELAPLPASQLEPLQQWAIDVCGPLPASEEGFRYVVALQDRFSKWVEATAMTIVTAEGLIEWLRETIFPQLGKPQTLWSDRGSQFESEALRDFLVEQQVEHHLTSVYHHGSNGLIERWMRTMEDWLRTAEGDWARQLPRVVQTYRTTTHAVTGHSPYRVLWGEEAHLPIDDAYQIERRDNRSQEEIISEVRENLRKAEVRMKSYYDCRNRVRPVPDFHDQRVYWHNVVSNKQGKLQARSFGPFKAFRTDNPRVFRIVGRDHHGKEVHVDQLKRCFNDQVQLDRLRGRGRPRNSD